MSKCRSCGSMKWRKDICPVCAYNAPKQTLRMHGTGRAISATTKHGFHAPMAKVQVAA